MANAKKTTNKELGLITIAEASIAPETQAELPLKLEQLRTLLASKKGVTDKTVSLDINYNGKQIKDITSVGELMEISASIDTRYNAYNSALDRLNKSLAEEELPKANVVGWSQSNKNYVEWMAIIHKAAIELINKVEINIIEETIKDLEECLSADDKLAAKRKDAMSKMAALIK